MHSLKKVAAALLILAISLALGEIGLRIVHRISPSYVFHDDSYNRFRVRPGSSYYGFPINSLGFHDTEFSKADARPSGSSPSATPSPSGLSPIGQLPHPARGGPRASWAARGGVQHGHPPHRTADYLNLLVNEGLALEPDLVLVSFYIGNDLIETHRSLHRNRPLHQRSYVVSLLRFALRLRNRAEGGVFHDRQVYSDDAPTFSRPSYIEIIGDRAKVYLVGWDGMAASVDAVMDAIERMSVICRRRGIPVAVVLIPEETQLDPNLQAALSLTYRLYREARWTTCSRTGSSAIGWARPASPFSTSTRRSPRRLPLSACTSPSTPTGVSPATASALIRLPPSWSRRS